MLVVVLMLVAGIVLQHLPMLLLLLVLLGINTKADIDDRVSSSGSSSRELKW